MSTLDEDALATLTPEERAAIEDDTPTPGDVDALKSIAGSADDSDDDEDDGDDGDDAKPADKPTDAAKADKPATPAADSASDEAPEPTGDRPARYAAELPTDFNDKLQALKAQDADLRAKFKAGEIDMEQRDEGLAALTEQREDLLVQRTKAETLQAINDTNAKNEDTNFEANFVKRVRNDGVDYGLEKNQRLFNTSLQEVLEDNPKFTRAQAWDEAHKLVARARGVTLGEAPPPPPAKKADPVGDAVAKRKAPLDAAPKTLAQVPGGDGPGDMGGEFSDIEALDGLELEDAIARLTPAAREKFMRSR